MSAEQTAEVIHQCIDMRLKGPFQQVAEAFKARDAKRTEDMAALRQELAALRGEVRALKAERRRADALGAEAERCELVRREAQAAESRLSRRQ
ncbi:hypothetical protein [Cupriavidus metallidurans]|nr:hypothetical protein [Cupriavidus metallidurans]QGS30206.1 hypothetical protein FOB83_15655 [Cupriavidus metallidurans]